MLSLDDDLDYMFNDNVWEQYHITDIKFNFDKETRIFETRLYFDDNIVWLRSVYFTRFLYLDELLKLHSDMNVKIPCYILHFLESTRLKNNSVNFI